MSKYILVVDLPDDSKCTGCKTYRYLRNGGLGLLFHDVGSCGDRYYPEIINQNRPSDCPLIPVDRVMRGIDDLDDQYDFASMRAIERCIEYLRMELG